MPSSTLQLIQASEPKYMGQVRSEFIDSIFFSPSVSIGFVLIETKLPPCTND